MRWWAHWGIQYLLAHVPGGETVHRLIQEQAGQLRNLEQGNQFGNALRILEMASGHAGSLAGLRVAEIGTGWVPAIPVALALVGCKVHTFDVTALTKQDYLRRTLNAWEPRLEEIAVAARQPVCDVTKRWETLCRSTTLSELCQKSGGVCLAPVDTTALPDATGTFDLVVSNLVMQCIPDALVVPVLRESARILKPSGWSIHRIRMTDEYAFSDPHQHHLHYLTYQKATWDRWFNHRLKNQNRWRASHFLDAFRDVGFLLREVRRHQDTSGAAYLQKVPLALEFQSCDEDDLNTIGMDVVLQKPSLVGDLRNTPSDAIEAVSTKA
jgi:SAM-dependent methyltransferase